MEVKQIYEIINNVSAEILGKTDMIQEDLTGIVDVGNEIFNANAVENYTRALIDHIGKMIFVNRVYKSNAPKVLIDGWEFGSILEKVRIETPEAQENETWELEDGASYDENIFYKPKVSAKFFDKRVTFEVPMSFTNRQLKSAFSNATQLNSFVSMIWNAIEKSITTKQDALIMRTINNFIGETIYDLTQGDNGKLNSYAPRVVNLLYMYNTEFSATLTPEQAMHTPEFLRYATKVIGNYINYLTYNNTQFNIGGKESFTPKDLMHVVLLSEFAKAQLVYLQSDTYHKELLELPYYKEVPAWQTLGKDETFAKFETISTIDITTSEGHVVNQSGIVGVVFDRDALGVSNLEKYVTTKYNAKAEFTNNWYKYFAGYFNDLNENFVVFIVA